MTSDAETGGRGRGLSRRGFLAGVGAGAAGALVLSDVEALAKTVEGPVVEAAPDPRFSRVFQLPAFADPRSTAVRNAMLDIGKPGGIMDAQDDLAAGPVRLITDPALSVNNPDNRNADNSIAESAGITFLGQFLDHDVTFDNTSRLGVVTEPTQTPNTRDPRLDLDSVYGGGPSVSPQLYSTTDRAKFKIGFGGLFEDLPRNTNLSAIISDPRNDENLMLAGLHSAILLAHNRTVDDRRQKGLPGDLWFYSRRTIIHHYQWIIVNEFLPTIVGQSLVTDILRNGRRWYRFAGPSMPVEFQTGTYRFGHSLIRPSYRANLDGDPNGSPSTGAPAFFGMVFDPAAEGQADPIDLRGGARAPRRFIGWQTFFDFPGETDPGSSNPAIRPNKKIDTRISTPLFNLPLQTIPSRDAPTSLPQRNLLRHLTWSLPSGQRIAAATGSPVLASSNFPELKGYGLGLDASTPLWYYILREAAILSNGNRLGPVGGRIVAESIIGMLQLDEASYLNNGFRPTLPSTTPGTFKMTDLLRWAKVDPASRRAGIRAERDE